MSQTASNLPNRFSLTGDEERIDIIVFEIFLPFLISEQAPKVLLETLRKHMDCAVPTRFGTFEPLSEKLLPKNDVPFIEMWEKESSTEFGGSFHWKAKHPCYGGCVSFSDRRESPARAPLGFARRHWLLLRFDARCFFDGVEASRLVDCFNHLCNALGAFYGAAYVEHGAIVTKRNKNRLVFDGAFQSYNFYRSLWWLGLPSKPVWLSWFGTAYAIELASVLQTFQEGDAKISLSNGVALRMGLRPVHGEDIHSFPTLPKHLLRQEPSVEYIPSI